MCHICYQVLKASSIQDSVHGETSKVGRGQDALVWILKASQRPMYWRPGPQPVVLIGRWSLVGGKLDHWGMALERIMGPWPLFFLLCFQVAMNNGKLVNTDHWVILQLQACKKLTSLLCGGEARGGRKVAVGQFPGECWWLGLEWCRTENGQMWGTFKW
jgi:hypothetical protein